VLILTSLDVAQFSAEDILAIYRLRWQIELLFKRLKSLLHLDELPAKDPDLVRAAAKRLPALLDASTKRIASDDRSSTQSEYVSANGYLSSLPLRVILSPTCPFHLPPL
jgi:hypothetical protein